MSEISTNRKHESYGNLIWTLAKTDFTLRYHGSILGYLWALLKPLIMFTVMYFVFSSMFNVRNTGQEYYALELLVGILLFTFFSEGTMAGMTSLLAKSQLVTKIYVPRWCIIIASTLNSAMIFIMNLAIIFIFALVLQFVPSMLAIALFFVAVIATYILIVAFSLLTAPLFIRFRDLQMIWEVASQILFYASPIIYPLSIIPDNVQRVVLISPIAFIIHFTKESLVNNHFADIWQYGAFCILLVTFFTLSVLAYQRLSGRIAEYM